jgi:hypothetical protein
VELVGLAKAGTAPAWLVSLVFHMALLLVLALMTFPVVRQTILDLEIAYSDDTGEQLDSFELSGLDDLNDEAELAFEQLAVEDLLAAPPEITFDPSGLTLAPDVVAPSIGFALTGREEGAKERLLAAYGGTGQTEAAVQMGLEWLKRIKIATVPGDSTGPTPTGPSTRTEPPPPPWLCWPSKVPATPINRARTGPWSNKASPPC